LGLLRYGWCESFTVFDLRVTYWEHHPTWFLSAPPTCHNKPQHPCDKPVVGQPACNASRAGENEHFRSTQPARPCSVFHPEKRKRVPFGADDIQCRRSPPHPSMPICDEPVHGLHRSRVVSPGKQRGKSGTRRQAIQRPPSAPVHERYESERCAAAHRDGHNGTHALNTSPCK